MLVRVTPFENEWWTVARLVEQKHMWARHVIYPLARTLEST